MWMAANALPVKTDATIAIAVQPASHASLANILMKPKLVYPALRRALTATA